MLKRIIIGAGGAALGTIVAGPVGAAAGWKLGGLAVTGNPLHLIPGGGLIADSLDVSISAFGGTDVSDIDDGRRPKVGW